MPGEIKKEIQLEITHVLLYPIVGSLKLSINGQGVAVDQGITPFARYLQTGVAAK